MKGKEYNDLWVIFENLSKLELDRIPEKYQEFVRENMVPGVKSDIDPTVPIEEQILSQKTKDLLACLVLTYWAESVEDRRITAESIHRNELAYQGKDPAPMTEDEYQDLLSAFDYWNEVFGPIPYWAESRGR